MASYELTRAADRDLTDIYAYTHRTFGPVQADTYLQGLEKCLILLAEMPGLGRRIDRLRPGYRRFEHASHSIFYIEITTGIRVVRILHQRMDPERHL